MKPLSGISYLYLSAFSNPVCDRVIYRTIRRNRVASILEIGIGDGRRATNMIRVAKKYCGTGAVRYTGIDGFEADSNSKVSLKEFHQQLSKLEVKLQLVPGDVAAAVQRVANSHLRTDLLVISSSNNSDAFDDVWYFVPRMLHAASIVFLQQPGSEQGSMETLGRLEIERRVKRNPTNQTRAA